MDSAPLLPGVRFVTPWSEVERFSTREEQWPRSGEQAERIPALSSEQMGMNVDAAVRWQIDPQQAPRIYTEIGGHEQIESVVQNAIRNGVRDGMSSFSINQIADRNMIADRMKAEVDSALETQPRAGGPPFRIAEITAFFLRDLQPPEQVVQAINSKIAQEQQVETERHRVDVARLQAEQQRLLNQTLTPEALTKQYLEVLEGMKTVEQPGDPGADRGRRADAEHRGLEEESGEVKGVGERNSVRRNATAVPRCSPPHAVAFLLRSRLVPTTSRRAPIGILLQPPASPRSFPPPPPVRRTSV